MKRSILNDIKKALLRFALKISAKEVKLYMTPQTFKNNEEAIRKFYKELCDEYEMTEKCPKCGNFMVQNPTGTIVCFKNECNK